MTLPPSSSSDGAPPSTGFERLHPGLQRWIWRKGWPSLRDIQEKAINAILDGDSDLLIAAATAGGKTEAALLPILTQVAQEPGSGARVLVVSPLKALINDQYQRLEELGEAVELPVHRWHGDVAQPSKSRFLKSPSGVLLITPESLEAMFILRGTLIRGLFADLEVVVIDELHAFIGTERGRQLQTLLHRLELVLRRRVRRVALSATLGDMHIAAEFLRTRHAGEVVHLVSSDPGGEVRAQIRGYLDRKPLGRRVERTEVPSSVQEIMEHMYARLRGQRNLIFVNNKSGVEIYSDGLRRLSVARNVPNEFHPHHGSLSKALREDVERLLKTADTPSSAVCTSTLELGIDIGDVESVAQVGPAPSVANLRQRLGRSGRRGQPAVLRIYVDEPEIEARTPLLDTLRLETVEAIAMLQLLARGWIEPPVEGALHLSTLVQQTLSVIAQVGGASAKELWQALCGTGPFDAVDSSTFARFLRELAARDLVVQSSEGTLLLGQRGERLVGNYDFYSAFASDDEYRIECEGRVLGSIPIHNALIPGQMLIFGGRRWTIRHVDEEAKRVTVVPAAGGAPPHYESRRAMVHDKVREEMFRVYLDDNVPAFLDGGARLLLAEGREAFRKLDLAGRRFVNDGDDCHAFLWAGDRVLSTICALLERETIGAVPVHGTLSVSGATEKALVALFEQLLARPVPVPKELASAVVNKRQEKHDWCLSEELLCADYASRNVDLEGAHRVIRRVIDGVSPITESA